MHTKPGMWIAFSTTPGDTASDGGEEGGPYALALAEELVKGGQDQEDVFFNTKQRVSSATGGHQVPWTNDGMLVRHYLAGRSFEVDLRLATQLALLAERELENDPVVAMLLALEALAGSQGDMDQFERLEQNSFWIAPHEQINSGSCFRTTRVRS